MSEVDNLALLKDLALLIRKHGPAAFADLARYINDPENLRQLTAILEAAEKAGRLTGVPESGIAALRGAASRASIQQTLQQIGKEEPEKAQLLSAFYEALTAKRALPSLRELQSFAHDNGLAVVNAKSRDKAVGPLIRDLAKRSVEEIQTVLRRIHMVDIASGDRSLEGWAGVILKRSRGGT